MRSIRKKISQSLSKVVIQGSVAFFTMLCGVQSVIADVVPTTNSAATGTTVSQPTTGRFDITDGTTSGDGANLFHGFSQFDLNNGETANFITQPQIDNVISYITGAPSAIDGAIEISNSDANLYLINPSGILFGPNVSLLLPGHFTAATATDLEFDNQWLNLSSDPAHTIDYSVLSGPPTAFGFSLDSPIVNLGNLEIPADHSLALLGGTAVNTGTLSTSRGNITITAIEQGNLLRINHSGSLVSLEVAAATTSGLTASSLSTLLTGAPTIPVNSLTINPDNTVSLTSTNTLIPEHKGSTIASGLVTTSGGSTGGNINLLGRRVGALDATLATRGFQNSGDIRVGGDRSIERDYTARFVHVNDSTTLNASAFDFGTGDGGEVTLRASDSTQFYGSIATHGSTLGGDGGNVAILGNRDLTYDGTVDLSAPRGNAGQMLFRTLNIDIENGTQVSMPSPPTGDIFTSPSLFKTTLYENTLEQFANLDLRSRHNIVIKPLTDDGTLSFQPGGSILFATDVDSTAGGGFSMRSQDTIHAPGSDVSIITGNSSIETHVGNILTESTDPSVAGTSGNIEILAQESLFASTLNAGDGKISIIGNGLDLFGGAGSITADEVSISPRDSDININIGDASAANTLELGNRDTEALNGNINRLVIGAADGIGQILLSESIATNATNPFKTPTLIQGNTNNPDAVQLVGPNLSTTWTITGRNSGTLSNYEQISFSDIANIVGGNADDTFVFANEMAQIEQLIDGKAGTLTFSGDSIELASSIEGTEDLFIQPQTAGRIIHLNRADNIQNTLSITAEELSGLRGDFTSLEIGRSDSGRLTLTGDGYPSADFTLRSGAEIDAIASNLFSNTEGASINLIASSDISIGNLSTLGGDINVISPGSITTGYLNATGTNTGGNITVTTNEFFRAMGGIDSDGSGPSIATDGSGQITVTHGGNGRTPFTIGDTDQNGTSGGIATQAVTQTSGLFYRNFIDSSDSIRILTTIDTTPPEPPTEPTTPQTPQPQMSVVGVTPQLEDSSNSEFGTVILSASDAEDAEEVLGRIETSGSNNFLQQLDIGDNSQQTKVATLSQIQKTLSQARQNLSIQPSLLYVYFVPDAASPDFSSSSTPAASPNDQLEIMLITPDGQPIKRRQWGVTRAQVEEAATELRHQVTSQFSMPQNYLKPGQQLYDWLVRPIQAELAAEGTDNIALVLSEGLRTIPIAAMHDGEQFLVESYSLGIMPTFSLTQLNTEPLNAEATAEDHPENRRVLAMGASRFENQSALPAVEAELKLIAEQNQASRTFLNEDFTLENLSAQIASNQYGIVHLATHANFESGDLDGSYIQLWDERINLTTLKDLSLNETDIALIILSACNTAMGDRSSEYGFAGFAISAGSESALASLWPVSDEGTLGFMTQFYKRYADRSTRSEALRQAQISMLNGQVRISDGHIKDAENTTLATIPQLAQSGNWDFSHPYYWSAFTMIGNPW